VIAYFDENPTRPRRALQVWLILIAYAYNRRTLTYSDLAMLIGYNDVRPVGQVLDYVWYYCQQVDLPPLTGLVVNKTTGLPGDGMGNYTLAEQEQVFAFNWYNLIPPTPEQFEEAYQAGRASQT